MYEPQLVPGYDDKYLCLSFEGYSATCDGRVFTHRRRWSLGKGRGSASEIDYSYQKRLKGCVGGGYIRISIIHKAKLRTVELHVVLCDAFYGPRPEGLDVRHLDCCKLNNSIDNLCYGTRSENIRDSMRCGIIPTTRDNTGEKNPRTNLKNEQIIYIRTQCAAGVPRKKMVAEFGLCRQHIGRIVRGEAWKHLL